MNDHPHLEEFIPPPDRRPNVKELVAFLRGPLDVRSVSLSVLLIFALGATLYVARTVMMPIVLALLLSFLLAPLVKGLPRLRVPSPLGAAVVLFAILGVVSLGLYGLWGPATQWIQQIPKSVGQIEAKIRPVRQSVEELSEAHHIRDEHLGRDRRQNRFLSIAFHVASGRTASAAALN